MSRGVPPKPPEQRRRRNKPISGEWQPTVGSGWQHGPIPEPPDGLLTPSRDAWLTWFGAWFAVHWLPEHLPGLRTVVKLYDQVERGEFQRAAELRMAMDGYGITPHGAQLLHWAPPKADEQPKLDEAPKAERYGTLRAV
jgi:hypothetical protein